MNSSMDGLTSDDEDVFASGLGSTRIDESTTFASYASSNTSTTLSGNISYTASTAVLAVVGVLALLALILFTALILRYWFSQKGTYRVEDSTTDLKLRQGGNGTNTTNICDVETTKEWLL